MAIDPSKQRTRITVMRVFEPEEVFREDPGATSNAGNQVCPLFTEGQEFLTEGGWPSKPEGFWCGPTWEVLWPYVLTIHNGGNFTRWVKVPGKAVVTCPDGFRPVVFKIERLSPVEDDTE